jgi:hypothetical protein
VVGYFNHQEHETQSRRRSVPTPAQLLEQELVDERGRSSDGCVFRLLFGKALTAPAAHVLRSWYWLCRWRHADGDVAVRWREDLVDVLERRLQRGQPPRAVELAALAWPLFAERGAPFFDALLDATADRASKLLNLDSKRLRLFETWRAQFLDRTSSEPVLDLLLYFVRMRATVRIDATPGIASFHPKIYVVERRAHEGHGEDAIVVTGSGNWSPGAFGRTPTDRANVEVATVHRVGPLSPDAWAGNADDSTPALGLGSALVATAAHLFAAGKPLASWDDPQAASPEELDDCLRLPETALPPEPEPPPAATPSKDPVAPILRSLIERTLGLGDITSYAQYERVFGGDAGLWGGRRPSRYQLDGALRLLAILEGAPALGPGEIARPPERGAFLTDEPGLGKTLIAQIVVATLASERLRTVHLGRRPDVPLRISVIAPARIAGREGRAEGAATGWHSASAEIRHAVRQALTELRTTTRDYVALDPAKLTEFIDARVLSTTSFGRHVETSDGSVAGDVIDDWLHVARSEIVVIDESHNFRNGQAAATRAIRFLLTLPVPGEAWPMAAGAPTEDHGEKAAAEAAADGRRPLSRKVLCLSATPFNNRLEDFITQVAHFARYQAWCLPEPTQGELFSGLRAALAAWCDLELPDSKRRDTFESLVRGVARHLASGRRLDDDEIKAEARERREKSRRRPEDEGPLYDWARPYDDLRRSFAQVSEWLQDYIQGDSNPEDESDARARVDALLARLVVQRSRRRILGMMKREGTLANSFRAPDLPRHPLAIGVDADGGTPTFEAKVLAKLYDLLPAAAGAAPQQERVETDDDRLNLFSYEIGVRRGREESRTGGTDETAIRNAVGFQAAGLIKRLQSSPYAFLRTLARGPLRRALFELAVVEAAAVEGKSHEGDLASRIREAGQAAAAFGKRISRQWGSRGEAIAGLLGGVWEPTSPQFLRNLVGVTASDQRARFDLALARTRAALEGGGGKRRARPGEGALWLDLLLADLRASRSKLWTDIEVALGWILEEGDEGESDALLDSIYRHLEDRHVGLPMDQLRAVIDRGDAYVGPVARWLRARLVADRRAGWLLGLLVVLAAMDLENVKRPKAERLGPGGTKILIFTEYADTQSYLLALAAGLRRTASDPSSRRLHDTLLGHVAMVAMTLQEQAERIAASGSHARSFRSPVDADWTLAWEKRARGEPQLMRAAIEHACAALGWASSAGAGLLDEEGHPDDTSDVEPIEGDDDAPSPPLSDDPVLDGFSPWYQISPDPDRPEAAAQVRGRMHAALRRPVRTLLATEILAEGVNLQECGIVAHYDLPWNPTRLIQRNGRVDRRLDPRFEDLEGRLAVCEALNLDTAAAEAYDPPTQIFHFTVLPIEPAFGDSSVDPPAERVRRVLTRKLKSIRVLFGLASWPVVLRAADAQRVLTGELEFETPGFRRRERLFEQWRRLADRGAQLSPDEPGGTLVVNADGAWFESLAAESAGSTATGWNHVRAAIVQTSPRGRPVHSAVDWQVAMRSQTADGAPVTTISGSLLMDGDMVGWDYRQRRHGDVPRWSFMPTTLSLRDGTELPNKSSVLSAVDDEGRARIPTSPTSFAEDILSVAIDAVIDAPGSAVYHATATPPLPQFEPEATAWLRWYLARPFLSAKLNQREDDDVLAADPPAGRWNLWVVRT